MTNLDESWSNILVNFNFSILFFYQYIAQFFSFLNEPKYSVMDLGYFEGWQNVLEGGTKHWN